MRSKTSKRCSLNRVFYFYKINTVKTQFKKVDPENVFFESKIFLMSLLGFLFFWFLEEHGVPYFLVAFFMHIFMFF